MDHGLPHPVLTNAHNTQVYDETDVFFLHILCIIQQIARVFDCG